MATNPAYQLWVQRSIAISDWLGFLPPVTAATIDVTLQEVLGVNSAQLLAIATQNTNGMDITPVLAQLGLSSDAFSALVGTVNLVLGGLELLASEISDFSSILAEVWKERGFAAWRLQEAAADIILGPQLFQLSTGTSNGANSCSCSSVTPTPPAEPALPEWRATAAARQTWEDTLNARTEQQSTTITALQNVVDSAEGATLTQLRDALVQATNAPGGNLANQADWLTENLMIDCETSGCEKTTRIEQALETLQSIMNGVRNGQIGSLDLNLASAPVSISAMGPNRIDVFVQGSDNALWHKWWDGTSGGTEGVWNEWESLGGVLTSAPAVTTHDANGSMDVFVRGSNNGLWYLGYNGSWQNWKSFGSPPGGLASAPAAGSQELGAFDVFVTGADAGLWQMSGSADPISGAGGGPWTQVARSGTQPTGGVASAPAIARFGTAGYDVIARGGDNALWHTQFNGTSWSAWESLGGVLSSGPAAVSPDSNTLYVFGVGSDSAIWYRKREHTTWGAWTSLHGSATQGPGASSWGSPRVDVFTAGTDLALWHRWWDGTSWHNWEGADGLTIGDPNFDEDWSWMGSYATWRSAILVFMYPQNILDPTLRAYQTPGFQQLVNTVQNNPSLTADQACQAANAYASYFADVCSITLQASCEAPSLLNDGSNCSMSPTPQWGSWLYLFGLASASNTIYWLTYDSTDTSGYGQTFWNVIPGLQGHDVISIVGSAPFVVVSANTLYVFLFYLALDGGVLHFRYTRYNPSTPGQNGWDGEFWELSLPSAAASLTVQMGQLTNSDAPSFLATLPDGSTYQAQMNADGTNWSTAGWTEVAAWAPWTIALSNGGAITGISASPDRIDLFWGNTPDLANPPGVWWTGSIDSGAFTQPVFIPSTLRVYSRITAVSRMTNLIDIFAVDADGTVSWAAGDPTIGQWSAFVQIGPTGALGSETTVAAVALNSSRIDLFGVAASDGSVQWNSLTWDNGILSQQGWITIGDPTNPDNTTGDDSETEASPLTAVARNGNRIDVFMIDANQGGVRQNTWAANGRQWSNSWQLISQPNFVAGSIPRAISRSPTRIDLLVGGPPGSDWSRQTFWSYSDSTENSGAWQEFTAVGNQPPGFHPEYSLLARTPTRIEVFVSGVHGSDAQADPSDIFMLWEDDDIENGAWHDWTSLSNNTSNQLLVTGDTPIAAISRVPQRIDLFFVFSTSAAIFTTSWPWTTWQAAAVQQPPFSPNPKVSTPLDIPSYLSSGDLQTRRGQIRMAFENNAAGPKSNLEYLREAYYFVPVYLALQLTGQGLYTPALDWFRTVYDYSAPEAVRNIYYGFDLEAQLAEMTQRTADWLQDPLNPHSIAVTRRYAYLRYTVLSIVQCISNWADALYTYDTSESDAQARTLYMMALDLLALPIFSTAGACDELQITVNDLQTGDSPKAAATLNHALASVNVVSARSDLVPEIRSVLKGSQSLADRLAAAQALIVQAKSQLPPPARISDVLSRADSVEQSTYAALLAMPAVDAGVTNAATAASAACTARATATLAPTPPGAVSTAIVGVSTTGIAGAGVQTGTVAFALANPPTVPSVNYSFCIPPDPFINTHQMHAEACLYQLRNCMNIAGVVRQVDPYSASTSICSGLPTIGAGGQLQIPGALQIQPHSVQLLHPDCPCRTAGADRRADGNGHADGHGEGGYRNLRRVAGAPESSGRHCDGATSESDPAAGQCWSNAGATSTAACPDGNYLCPAAHKQ